MKTTNSAMIAEQQKSAAESRSRAFSNGQSPVATACFCKLFRYLIMNAIYKSNLLLIACSILIATGCTNAPTKTRSTEYDPLMKQKGLIVVTDENDNPIDFVLFDPSSSNVNEIVEIQILADKRNQELGFYLAGDLIHEAIGGETKYIKSYISEGDHYFFNGAKFTITDSEITNFSGNGFSSDRLKEKHLEFALANFENPDFEHKLEVVYTYLIDDSYSYPGENEDTRIICTYRPNTKEFVLEREASHGMWRMEIPWERAEERWIEWRKSFMNRLKTSEPTSA